MKKSLPDGSKGQILLLVLLGMAVALVVALSVASRSIVDISLTSRDVESQRAFSAAEAGVEKALITGQSITSPETIDNAQFSVDVSTLIGGVQGWHPNEIKSGESLILWFVPQDTNGQLSCSMGNCFTGTSINICFGDKDAHETGGSANASAPAIEVSVFYDTDVSDGDYGDVKVGRLTADPYSIRASSNHFSVASNNDCTITSGGSSRTFAFQTTVAFSSLGITNYSTPNALQFAKIKTFYNDTVTPIAYNTLNCILGICALPPQGLVIQSTGTSGDTTRKVEVFQTYGEPPWIFEGVFSETSIEK